MKARKNQIVGIRLTARSSLSKLFSSLDDHTRAIAEIICIAPTKIPRAPEYSTIRFLAWNSSSSTWDTWKSVTEEKIKMTVENKISNEATTW